MGLATAQIPVYNKSLIEGIAVPEIYKLLRQWKGVKISKAFKKHFEDKDYIDKQTKKKTYHVVIDEHKFFDVARNWSDTNSFKATGFFFAEHIKQITAYFHSVCRSILNIPLQQRMDFLNYICIYFVSTVLSAKITGFDQSGQRKLFPNKPLTQNHKASKTLRRALKAMYDGLDISALLEVVKKNKVNDPLNDKPSSKYKVASGEFCEHLVTFCGNLLEAERVKLGLVAADSANDPGVVPLYFREAGGKRYEVTTQEPNGESSDDAIRNSGVPHVTPPRLQPTRPGDLSEIEVGFRHYPHAPRYYPFESIPPYYPCYEYERPPYGYRYARGGYHVGASPYFRYNPMYAHPGDCLRYRHIGRPPLHYHHANASADVQLIGGYGDFHTEQDIGSVMQPFILMIDHRFG